MKILVTSARLPHALGVIRCLGEAGHEVYASDTFRTSPGLHSEHVKKAIITASPTFDTRTFVGQIADAVKKYGIDLVLPAFEEVFYLSRHLGDLPHPVHDCHHADAAVRPGRDEQLRVVHHREGRLPVVRNLLVDRGGERDERVAVVRPDEVQR